MKPSNGVSVIVVVTDMAGNMAGLVPAKVFTDHVGSVGGGYELVLR